MARTYGRLDIGLEWHVTEGILQVTIHGGMGLEPVESESTTANPFVMVVVQQDGQPLKEAKTRIIWDSLCPVFSEQVLT